jgi:hypothetical protein
MPGTPLTFGHLPVVQVARARAHSHPHLYPVDDFHGCPCGRATCSCGGSSGGTNCGCSAGCNCWACLPPEDDASSSPFEPKTENT